MRSAALAIALLLLSPGALPAQERDAAPPALRHGEPAPRLLALPATGGAVDFDNGSVAFIGNATVLIRYAGFTILTDPNFLPKGATVALGFGDTTERLVGPAVAFEALPVIDFVLLSHLHEDHFDAVVEAKLAKTTPIVTTPAAAEQLRERGFAAAEGIGPWQVLTVTKGEAVLRVTAMPARHGPPVFAKGMPPVMGSLLEFDEEGIGRYRIYITGDTLIHDDIKHIPMRYRDVDLALLHLGGMRVRGVTVTMGAEEGVELLRRLAPRTAIPIHYNDYGAFASPLADFVAAVGAAGLDTDVRYLRRGETYRFAAPP